MVYDGEVLPLTKVSRNEMGAYLCIATNGVPPSVSKRIILDVECNYKWCVFWYFFFLGFHFFFFIFFFTCFSILCVFSDKKGCNQIYWRRLDKNGIVYFLEFVFHLFHQTEIFFFVIVVVVFFRLRFFFDLLFFFFFFYISIWMEWQMW